ncbi:tRNA (adenosine(37)-N6)-threonylcarbamoyltransferase complex dimerization subunit type 1 TsaB [Martelella mediterranea]|uniref:tRNA threonylcarbamoyl adenosine modification protein YeaZ n=1 Tax=Martelella mediterranea TaxID=293089 RepID=A0A4R3P1C8_9HYPH|nr:tRNA (adenosine(37)-N6)-threonylcarbamoyltransferase complex dimerization subunit type 1 TsaB [Martelella mediterranea]TCT43039.1 tRNA threonylcarbamoyl adenosine modification protein YeaZ [Martelella mediterranea]
MIILALDTAAADCAACLLDTETDRVLARVSETIGKGHAERLMAVLDACLSEADMKLTQVHRIAVNIGPGSFTGIRVGVSTARALAVACGCQCVGVSSLGALAAQHSPRLKGCVALATIDARRGEAYIQAFDAEGEPLSEPSAVRYDELERLAMERQAVAVGSGAVAAGIAAPRMEDNVAIETIARLGAVAKAETSVAPLYLRAPDAKPQAGFTLARA